MNEIIIMNNVTKIFKIKNKSKEKFFKKFFCRPTYRDIVAVNNVNLKINSGEFVGLVGNNGAGKSTLIKMMTGILYNSSGDIEILGNNPYKSRIENNKNISVVFGQRTQLRWDLCAIDSFELLKAIYNIEDKTYKENLYKFIELFEMESFIHQPVRTLSLGQKMKCEITAAFLHNPKIVFLDEPTIGLDIFSKDAIVNFLREMKRTTNTTIILTTHDMNEIKEVCDRAVFLDKGKIILDKNINEIITINSRKNVVIITENKDPIKVENNFNLDIEYDEHKIILNRIDKNLVFDVIYEIVNKNIVQDITITTESFTDIVKKIYSKEV